MYLVYCNTEFDHYARISLNITDNIASYETQVYLNKWNARDFIGELLTILKHNEFVLDDIEGV